MKILKKHGKKVSVLLLAIALMITPMLPIVKAADSDTCEKRFHYYFLLAEEAWIDSADLQEKKITRQYSDEMVKYFGLTQQEVSTDSGTGIKIGLDGYTWGEGSGNGPITLSDGNTAVATAATGVAVTGYNATFYNYELDDAYKLSSTTPTITYWDDDDWDRYATMYENLQKVYDANANLGEGSYYQDDDDIYFIHYTWKESKGDDNEWGEWKDSDATHALSGLWESFAAWEKDMTSQSVRKDILTKLKNASIDVTGKTIAKGGKTSVRVVGDTSSLGRNSDSPVIMLANRDFSGIQRPTFYGINVKVGNTSVKEDNYYWFYFPMEATYTFTASGDACKTDGGVIDTGNDKGVDSPPTGIVSYAIIGTLLVGAASAYIYARKNNKFNKV